MKIQLPKKLRKVFRKKYRYRGAYGGRGSGKSVSFIRMLLVRGASERLRILCARELQNSIKDSVHAEIVAQIEALGLQWAYEWGESFIRGRNGTEFLFKGLRHNVEEIKSTSGVDICFIEEAETVSDKSWQTLIPTIRKPGSEIWLVWNPRDVNSATKRRFIDNPPSSSCIVEMNWSDNPWFPPELDQERLDDMARDYDLYLHIWEGQCITRSDAQVFNGKWRVADFQEPQPGQVTGGPYYGLDFGFARDPMAVVRCYIVGRTLYISHEAGGVGVEVTDMSRVIRKVPGVDRHQIRCDSARPELISHLRSKDRLQAVAAEKWPGSVEDGITFIRSFDEIVIHSRCAQVAREFKAYSYKVDRYTHEVLSDIIDKDNHYIDALRYALQPIIRTGNKFRISR